MDGAELSRQTLEGMKRISGKLDTLAIEVGDLKLRQSTVEDHLSGLTVSLVAGLTHRIDRIKGRLDRVERHLDLRSDV